MGNSILTYLAKARSGVIFHETFENDNFITAQGWTVLSGAPANTSNQYKGGIKSFLCNLNDTIRKTITDTQSGTQMFSGFFYDDTTHTTEQGPYLKLKTSNNKFIQIGVRNGVSSTYYVTNATDTFTEDSFAVTTVARVTGWHKFDVLISAVGVIQVKIDNTLVRQHSALTPPFYFTYVFCCSNTIAGTGASFGYFDEIYVFHNSQVNIQGLGSRTAVEEGVQAFTIFPLQEHYRIDQSGSLGARTSMFTQLMDVYPGDIYVYNEIDFGRRVTMLQPIPRTLTSLNQSAGGFTETFKFGLKDVFSFLVDVLDGIDWKQKADMWYYHASQGNPFSLLVDKDHPAIALVSAALSPLAADTFTITIDTSQTIDTSEFTVGRRYVIRGADNFYKQVAVLASKTDTTLTFTGTLMQPVAVGDYVYDQLMFPLLELGNQPLGLRLTDARNVLYQWNQAFQDFNG